MFANVAAACRYFTTAAVVAAAAPPAAHAHWRLRLSPPLPQLLLSAAGLFHDFSSCFPTTGIPHAQACPRLTPRPCRRHAAASPWYTGRERLQTYMHGGRCPMPCHALVGTERATAPVLFLSAASHCPCPSSLPLPEDFQPFSRA